MSKDRDVGELVGSFALGIGAMFLEGRVLCDLWRWFVVPLGAMPLRYWHAMGLALVVNMLTRTNGVERDHTEANSEAFGLVLLSWGIGWLFSLGVQP